jgi:hypothetical protein
MGSKMNNSACDGHLAVLESKRKMHAVDYLGLDILILASEIMGCKEISLSVVGTCLSMGLDIKVSQIEALSWVTTGYDKIWIILRR